MITVEELIKEYSEKILDESNQVEQDKALTAVILKLLEELNQKANKKFIKRKKDIKLAIEETDAKYVAFVSEINKLAGKNLLLDNGFKMVTEKQFKRFS